MRGGEHAALLLLVAASAWAAWDLSRVEFAPAFQASATAARPRLASAPADGAFDAIVTRSLFAPSRRGDFSSVESRRGVVGGHALRGVVFGAGGAVALFEPVRGGAARRLRVGATIGAERIVGIAEGEVVLERDGRRRRLAIDEAGPALASPVAPTLPGAASVADSAALPIISEQTSDEEQR